MDILHAFTVLLIVVDPVGLALLFVALTHGEEPAQVRRMAFKGTAIALAMLLVFFLFGVELLRALGIGLPAFRIAGGVLLFLLAIDMIFARQSGIRATTAQERVEAARKEDISVFPLAFPLIAGPGALTTVLLMAAGRPGPLVLMGMLAALLGVLGLALLSLLFAPLLVRLLGETGTHALSRILGLLLAALAVQFMLDGMQAAWPR